MPRLGDVAIGIQNGAAVDGLPRASLDAAMLADLTLAAPPQDGDVFTMTVRCVASDCQVVWDGEQDRWSGVLTLMPASIVKDA